jgi:hypothetical protein
VGHPLFLHLLELALAGDKLSEVGMAYRDIFDEEAFPFAVGADFGFLSI